MSNTLTINDLDINKVTFVQGKSKPGRNPPISIMHNGQLLQLRLPRMNFPGGVMVRTDEKSGATSYTLMGTLKECDPYASERSTGSSDLQKIYNFLLDLEAKIISSAVENSVKWFGKKRSEEGIREGFNRIIGTSKDNIDGEWVPNGKYPPSFKCKLPVYDGRVCSEIVDGKRNPVYATPEALVSIFSKGCEVNQVVTGSIYVIAGGGFGVTWRQQFAQVFPKSRVTAADVFADEEDAPASEPVPESQIPESQAPAEESQVEEQPTPAAPTTQRKRRTAAA